MPARGNLNNDETRRFRVCQLSPSRPRGYPVWFGATGTLAEVTAWAAQSHPNRTIIKWETFLRGCELMQRF